MGRPRKDAGQGLPERVYLKSGRFYYVHAQGNRWEGLGCDLTIAKQKAAELSKGEPITGTMGKWLLTWHVELDSQVKAGHLSDRTRKDYVKDTKLLTEFFGEMYPKDIQVRHITDYLEIGRDVGRPIRANREKAALSSCMTWMVSHGHGKMPENPCLKSPRNPEKPRDRYITDDEYYKVFDLASAPVRAWMILIYRTLQRPEDVLSWTQNNIVEKNGIRVLEFRQGKTGKQLSIILNKEMEDAISAMKAAREVDGLPLIHAKDGSRYTAMGLSSMFRRHVVAAGIVDYALYDHKSKGATDMYAAGVPIETISTLCAHDSVTTTEIYIKNHTRNPINANAVVIKRGGKASNTKLQ